MFFIQNTPYTGANTQKIVLWNISWTNKDFKVNWIQHQCRNKYILLEAMTTYLAFFPNTLQTHFFLRNLDDSGSVFLSFLITIRLFKFNLYQALANSSLPRTRDKACCLYQKWTSPMNFTICTTCVTFLQYIFSYA